MALRSALWNCTEKRSPAGAARNSALRIATVVGSGARHTASPWRSEIFEKLGTTLEQRIVLPFAADSMISIVHVEDAARMLVLLATAN